MTPEQRRRLVKPPSLVLTFLLLNALLLSLAPTYFLYTLNSPHNPLFLLLPIGLLTMLLLSIILPRIRRSIDLSRPGVVASAQGEVIWRKDRCVIHTHDRELKLPDKSLNPPPPGPYHFYFLLGKDTLLSAQPISTDTGMLAYPNLLAASGLPGNEQARLALLDALGNTLDFTPEDLLWNRQGTLSPAQRETLLRKVASGMRWSLFFLPVSIAGTVALILFAPDWPVVVGAILIGIWCLSNLLITAPKKRTEIQQAVVSWKEGNVWAHEDPGDSDSGPSYFYKLDDLSFSVSYAAYQVLVHNTRYRLYYLPYAKVLLSMEPLEAPRRV